MSLAEPVNAVQPEWTLGNRIWRARVHARLEQTDIAQALGVSRALISRWEKDLSDIRVSQLKKVAEVTGVSYDWLLGVSSASGYKQDSADWLRDASYTSTVPEQVELPFGLDRRLSPVG